MDKTSMSLGLGLSKQEIYDHIISKAKWRIIPFLFLCFVVNYIDRSNVGFAKLYFQKDLGFSASSYGFGISLFFVGYLLFEVPSNFVLTRIGARKTLSRIMILWGLASLGTMLVRTPIEFYLARFLIGVFEAGFVPGVIFYLAYWFPSSHRARITSLFMIALPISGIISNPVSGLIIGSFNSTLGLAGWQWLFLLEGAPSMILGFFAFFYLCDRPREARWLSDLEKDMIEREIDREERAKGPTSRDAFRSVFGDFNIYIFAFSVFTQFCVANVFAFWGPTILRDSGISDIKELGLLNAIPFILATILMIAVGKHSDQKMERKWHASCGQILTIVGLLLLHISANNPFITIICLAMLACGHYVFWSIFWTIPPTYLKAKAAAVGIAIISSLGATGGIFASNLLGWAKETTGSLSSSLYIIAFLAFLGLLALHWVFKRFVQTPANLEV